jgi:diguanylate cyclase (GGDEF)-like protein
MNQTTQLLNAGFSIGWLAILIGVVAAQVALDFSTRIQSNSLGIAAMWLLGAALALATGAWASHVQSVAALPAGGALGYRAVTLTAFWLAGALFGAIGLWLAARAKPTRFHWVGGAALAGVGMMTLQLGSIYSIGAQAIVDWHYGALAMLVAATLAASMFAFYLQFVMRPRLDGVQTTIELVAAAVLGVAATAGAALALGAARLPARGHAAFADMVPVRALEPMASLGALVLLLSMMAWAVIDARTRRELSQAKVEVGKRSTTDALTSLPNRDAFNQYLDQLIDRAEAEKRRVALVHVNIDEFKLVNEMLGPEKADRVLRAFAQRLRGEEKEGDLAGRWVGDEFLLALSSNVSQLVVEQRVRRMLENLSEPFEFESRDIILRVSMGVAIYPEHGNRATLIANAGLASRAAKNAGGSTYCFFEARLMKNAREQAELLSDLRGALEKGELRLFYQPKVHAPSGKITAAEALIRWEHPTRGWISPAEFIPLAERFGLIGAIGNWVIEEACRQIREWRNGGLRMRVGINLSVNQLREPDLADRIAANLAKYDVNPTLLTCEITESLVMKDSDSTRLFFQKLAALGVHISIDDFGTGYSSLSYLRKLPAEELKIDRSFVLDLETSADARAVARAIVQLGLALNLKVVAEGVETEGQYEVLRELGCDEVQGYLFAKPMAAKMLTLWAMRSEDTAPTDFRPSLYGETAPMPLKR